MGWRTRANDWISTYATTNMIISVCYMELRSYLLLWSDLLRFCGRCCLCCCCILLYQSLLLQLSRRIETELVSTFIIRVLSENQHRIRLLTKGCCKDCSELHTPGYPLTDQVFLCKACATCTELDSVKQCTEGRVCQTVLWSYIIDKFPPRPRFATRY